VAFFTEKIFRCRGHWGSLPVPPWSPQPAPGRRQGAAGDACGVGAGVAGGRFSRRRGPCQPAYRKPSSRVSGYCWKISFQFWHLNFLKSEIIEVFCQFYQKNGFEISLDQLANTISMKMHYF
jgi:hypothetical protein